MQQHRPAAVTMRSSTAQILQSYKPRHSVLTHQLSSALWCGKMHEKEKPFLWNTQQIQVLALWLQALKAFLCNAVVQDLVQSATPETPPEICSICCPERDVLRLF